MGGDEIAQLETALAELARRWERYMAHDSQVPIPPERDRLELERRLRLLSRQEGRSTHEQFRLEQLLHRFATYCQLWQRQLRAREVGEAGAIREPQRPNAAVAPSVPAKEDEFAALHRRYAELVQQRGGQPMPLESFRTLLEQQRAQLEGKGQVVEGFNVVEVDGRLRIQARVRRGRKS
jgi:hypothetical protein